MGVQAPPPVEDTSLPEMSRVLRVGRAGTCFRRNFIFLLCCVKIEVSRLIKRLPEKLFVERNECVCLLVYGRKHALKIALGTRRLLPTFYRLSPFSSFDTLSSHFLIELNLSAGTFKVYTTPWHKSY